MPPYLDQVTARIDLACPRTSKAPDIESPGHRKPRTSRLSDIETPRHRNPQTSKPPDIETPGHRDSRRTRPARRTPCADSRQHIVERAACRGGKAQQDAETRHVRSRPRPSGLPLIGFPEHFGVCASRGPVLAPSAPPVTAHSGRSRQRAAAASSSGCTPQPSARAAASVSSV
jgi:hypothetical protein